ncbi:MAG: hypothetical protein ABR595_06645 [Psychroflexus sp.]
MGVFKIVRLAFLSFILGVILLYIFENFGQFNYSFKGDLSQTESVEIKYISPFGSEVIQIDDEISQAQRKNPAFSSYSQKVSFYAEAMQKDFWYALLFAVATFVLIYLAKQRKLSS